MIYAHDISQYLAEGALDPRPCIGAPLLSRSIFCGIDVAVGERAFHASSAQEPGRNEPITVSSPCWSARPLTSLATARSSTPNPNGLNTEKVSEPFLAGARPRRMSPKVHRMNFL